MKRLSLHDATIATVVYADIFEYPLTTEELVLWVPFLASLKRSHLFRLKGETLKSLRSGSVTYYGLRRVKKLVTVRQQRTVWSKKKILLVKRIARWFWIIPTITLVGVTGGLAMDNAKKEDDIDLFFITQKGTLWISRLLATVMTELLGVRRRPGDTRVRDKVCLNMFMAQDCLALPKSERDLFAAHEVLQMVPLWERERVYGKFLAANRWTRIFLPNAWEQKNQKSLARPPGRAKIKNQKYRSKIKNILTQFYIVILLQLEPVARILQLWYMKRHRTTEIVSASVIRFHPADARVWVREALVARLARYNIPLDKVFYGS